MIRSVLDKVYIPIRASLIVHLVKNPPGEGIGYPLQFSWASLVVQLVKNLPAVQDTWVQSLVEKVPWRRERLLTPVFWLGELGHKESDMTERLSLLPFTIKFNTFLVSILYGRNGFLTVFLKGKFLKPNLYSRCWKFNVSSVLD